MNSLLTVEITGSSTMRGKKAYTMYEVAVSGNILEPWTVFKRYSDFHALHEKVLKLIESDSKLKLMKVKDEIIIPDFPKKHMFGKNSQKVKDERQKALQTYMRTLLKSEDLCKTTLIMDFLQVPKAWLTIISPKKENISRHNRNDAKQAKERRLKEQEEEEMKLAMALSASLAEVEISKKKKERMQRTEQQQYTALQPSAPSPNYGNLPSAPNGWSVFRTADNQIFYQNDTTGETTWDRPVEEQKNNFYPQPAQQQNNYSQQPSAQQQRYNNGNNGNTQYNNQGQNMPSYAQQQQQQPQQSSYGQAQSSQRPIQSTLQSYPTQQTRQSIQSTVAQPSMQQYGASQTMNSAQYQQPQPIESTLPSQQYNQVQPAQVTQPTQMYQQPSAYNNGSSVQSTQPSAYNNGNSSNMVSSVQQTQPQPSYGVNGGYGQDINGNMNSSQYTVPQQQQQQSYGGYGQNLVNNGNDIQQQQQQYGYNDMNKLNDGNDVAFTPNINDMDGLVNFVNGKNPQQNEQTNIQNNDPNDALWSMLQQTMQ